MYMYGNGLDIEDRGGSVWCLGVEALPPLGPDSGVPPPAL